MYIAINGKLRPFLEATIDDVTYMPQYDRQRRVIQVREDIQISGRILQEEGTTPSNPAQTMSNLIASFRQELITAVRPRVTLFHDDLTVSCYDWNPIELIDGPYIEAAKFPRDGSDIFVTGNSYGLTVTAFRSVPGSQSSGVLEFSEVVDNTAGGVIRGHVGGIINPAEPQVFKAFEPWTYTQSGSAVGLYGYPVVPPPIWPGYLTRPNRPKRYSPEIVYPVPQRFKVDWSYEFQHQYALPGDFPHVFYS